MWENIPPVHNYIDQLIEDIHCEGSLISGGLLGGGMTGDVVTIEEVVTEAKWYEDKGCDAVRVGSRNIEDREALAPFIEQMQAIRKATNLIIVAMILPYTPGLCRGGAGMGVGGQAGPFASGPQLEEVVAMAKMLEGSADIIQMKDAGHYTNHPNSFSMERDKPWMLRFSQAIKESGVKIIICPTGGFHDPALNDEFIASGKCDMVGMATPFFADPEYVKKLYEGRAEDIVPCVKCHDCHGISRTTGPWFDVCSVNPKWGLSETKKRSIRPPTVIKKVAVIGGGPAGMKAAITAAERGHKVTLYERSDTLGGLQQHTDFTPYKWAYKDFKDYLIRQIYKTGVEVLLSTEVTPEMIRAKGYEAVLVAVGAEPVVSKIPGSDGKNVYNILSVYSNMKALGKNVVLIGGGVYGTETGICLALSGHKVTALTSEEQLIPYEFQGPHNKEIQLDIIYTHDNFKYVLEAIPTSISEGKVTYKDAKGSEKSVQADSVVIYAGLRPRMDEAMQFSGSAGQVLFVGDCTGQAGTLQKTIRSAFFMASQV
jgi:NADPH-dependent 2,4-dienoyl-CoA reductase/sulfur reductase-like enzyme